MCVFSYVTLLSKPRGVCTFWSVPPTEKQATFWSTVLRKLGGDVCPACTVSTTEEVSSQNPFEAAACLSVLRWLSVQGTFPDVTEVGNEHRWRNSFHWDVVTQSAHGAVTRDDGAGVEGVSVKQSRLKQTSYSPVSHLDPTKNKHDYWS